MGRSVRRVLVCLDFDFNAWRMTVVPVMQYSGCRHEQDDDPMMDYSEQPDQSDSWNTVVAILSR
jgi:hypothetical protein